MLWCDLARNYNGLSAIAGVHVRLSKEIQWFRCRQECYGAIQQGITMVAKTKYKFYLVSPLFGFSAGIILNLRQHSRSGQFSSLNVLNWNLAFSSTSQG